MTDFSRFQKTHLSLSQISRAPKWGISLLTDISKPQEVIWRSRLCTYPMVQGESPWAKASGDSSDFERLRIVRIALRAARDHQRVDDCGVNAFNQS